MPTIDERRADAISTTEAIEHGVTMLLLDRQTFSRFRDAVNSSAAVGQTHFPGFVARWYSQSILLGLRRLGDRNPRAHSLRVLFDKMTAHPDDWSLESIIEIWDATEHRYDREFLEMLALSTYRRFADGSGRRLNVGRIEADRSQLESALVDVKAVVDKTVAHAERHDGDKPTMTFKQLDAAVDVCHELVKPYIALLTGRGYSDMTPTEQHQWWRIFQSWPGITPFPT